MAISSPRVTWFIPPVKHGSGGLRTVFAHAKALEKKGFRTVLQVDSREPDIDSARRTIQNYYGYDFAHLHRSWQDAAECDVAIATVWSSAFPVAKLPGHAKKLYYVQDFEPWFYPMGSMYLAAEASYTLGLNVISIGRFLAHKLGREFNVHTAYHDFGANHLIYHPLDGYSRNEPSLCFLFQPGKERRAAELGLAALEIVAALRSDVAVYLFGTAPAEGVDFHPRFTFLGLLGLVECNALYNRCSLGLSLSCTNPSRVPFEMMAAGLPVIDLWRENTIFDLPEGAVQLSRQTPEDLAHNILALLDDPLRRASMGERGLAYMRRRTEDMEGKTFAGIIRSWLASGIFPVARDLRPIYPRPGGAR